jgi:hypothetical protein
MAAPVANNLLDRVDLTQLIIDHVSVDRIVETVDLDAVIARVDVAPIVDKAVHDVDLPEIVRSSSNSLASDTVHRLRLQSASADDIVDRIAARVTRRRPVDSAVATQPRSP